MIVKNITRFYDIRTGFAARIMAVGLAALLAVSFLNLAVLPGAALADEAGETSETTSMVEPAESQVLPVSEEADEGVDVYVYLQLSGDAAKAAEQLGLTHNNDGAQKWFTIGVIQLDIPQAATSEQQSILLNTEEASDELVALKADIDEALKTLVRFPDNEKLAIYGAQWNELKVCAGATDYPEANGSKAWHLDGELSTQLVKFEINYVDEKGQPLTVAEDLDDQAAVSPRTLFVAEGSEMDALDYVVDVPGYEYSEALTKKENGGNLVVKAEASSAERTAGVAVTGAIVNGADRLTLVYKKKVEEPVTPENPGNNGDDPSDNPVVPGDNGNGSGDNNGGTKPPAPSNTDVPKVPSITVPKPQQMQGNANSGNMGATNNGGFAAGERTQLSEPASQPEQAKVELAETAAAEEPALEAVSIDDDAVPMVTRAAGAEAIAEEEVPMGAFDAPVDPAPWVAGMGAIGTALWGVIAVRRRLVMAQKLASFESQVLGASMAEADAVAVPNAGHQAL